MQKTTILEISSLEGLIQIKHDGDIPNQKTKMEIAKNTLDKFPFEAIDLTSVNIFDTANFKKLCLDLNINLPVWKSIILNAQNKKNWNILKRSKNKDYIYSILELTPIDFLNKEFKKVLGYHHQDLNKKLEMKSHSNLFDFLEAVYTKKTNPYKSFDECVYYFPELLSTQFITWVKMFESVNLNNKHLNISVATHHFLQGYCPFPSWFLCLVHKIKKSKPGDQIILLDDDINMGESYILLNSPEFKKFIESSKTTLFPIQIYDPRIYPFIMEDDEYYEYYNEKDSCLNPSKGNIENLEKIFIDSKNLKYIFYDMSNSGQKDNILGILNTKIENKGFKQDAKTHVFHLCGFDNHEKETAFPEHENNYQYNKTWFTDKQRLDIVKWLTNFDGFYLFNMEGGYQTTTLPILIEKTLKIILEDS